jgi:hypothetical protein
MQKPLLLLDVDGPLNPHAAKPHRRPEGYSTHRLNPTDQNGEHWTNVYGKPLRVWLKESHGADLLKLTDLFTLEWASMWGPEANEWIGPLIGLPELPHVDFWADDPHPEKGGRGEDGIFWKTPLIVAYAAGRPFAWVDDEIHDADREYIAAHHTGPALPHYVSPRLGLLEPDFLALAEWAASLQEQ